MVLKSTGTETALALVDPPGWLRYSQLPMSPNVAIISATIVVVTLVFAIFGASWLNLRQIEKLLDQLEKRFEERVRRGRPTVRRD